MIWDIPSEKNTSQSVLGCGAYEPISQLRSALGQMGPFGPPVGTEMAQRRPPWLGPSVNFIYCGSILDHNRGGHIYLLYIRAGISERFKNPPTFFFIYSDPYIFRFFLAICDLFLKCLDAFKPIFFVNWFFAICDLLLCRYLEWFGAQQQLPPRTFNLFAINRYQRGLANSTNLILASSRDLHLVESHSFLHRRCSKHTPAWIFLSYLIPSNFWHSMLHPYKMGY